MQCRSWGHLWLASDQFRSSFVKAVGSSCTPECCNQRMGRRSYTYWWRCHSWDSAKSAVNVPCSRLAAAPLARTMTNTRVSVASALGAYFRTTTGLAWWVVRLVLAWPTPCLCCFFMLSACLGLAPILSPSFPVFAATQLKSYEALCSIGPVFGCLITPNVAFWLCWLYWPAPLVRSCGMSGLTRQSALLPFYETCFLI